MPLQTETMSATARAKRIKTGRNHGSNRTLAQSDDSLKAYDDLTPELQAQVAEHGYSGADRTELAAILSFLASPEGYRQLVTESGLSLDRYRQWLARAIRQAVVDQ